MSGFFYALITTFLWGCADVCYKLGADAREKYSHLYTSIAVGVVMGLHALITLITSGVSYDPMNLLLYLPVSAMYILSMTVGYMGFKYLALSVASPVQNASGALTCLLCVIVLQQALDIPSAVAVVLICAGVCALGVMESRQARLEDHGAENRQYRRGFRAFVLPLIYCVVDAMGTFLDAYYLDDFQTTPLVNVTEDTLETVANMSYEFTFLIVAILLFIYVRCLRKTKVTLKAQGTRYVAATFETAGQFAYVYAMSDHAAIAAPMIASYSIVAILLSRAFLKEKLSRYQYMAIALVLAGIAILGIVEGLAE